MKAILLILSLGSLCVAASAALASSIDCSNSDASWRFVQDTPDGGPMPPPGAYLPHWYINGVDTQVAGYSWVDGSEKVLSQTKSGNFENTVYAIQADLGSLGEGFMICTHSQYVGPPIP